MTNQAKITFVSSHRPQLSDGKYTIDVTQTFTAPHGAPNGVATKVDTHEFYVLGERFTLKPADIHSVFPPDRSQGEYSATLPQVILNRSTLPWERAAQGDANQTDSPPWLVLLLFTENELAGNKPQVITLGKLTSASTTGTFWPKFTLEMGQDPKDKVTVLDVPKKVLSPIMPSLTELGYLTHARIVSGEANQAENADFAVVVGNRVPPVSAQGQKPPVLVAHLVSVEGRYKNGAFDYQGADDTAKIRLISLKSWSYSCKEHQYTFTGLLQKLDQGTLQSPLIQKIPAQSTAAAKTVAQTVLGQGKIPLRHHFRNGQSSVSWYRGPLAPVAYSQKAITDHPLKGQEFPHHSADGLLQYDNKVGMFDVSYAAAWELGRLLALNSKAFSIALYHWKRAHAQTLRQVEQQELHPHKPHTDVPPKSLLMPKPILNWLSDLSQLKHVPFTYLVPEPTLLPQESIRFFTLDPEWIACLVDGAFSIGRVSPTESAEDRKLLNQANIPEQNISGFLLRSAVVAGWPALQANALDAGQQPISILRMERLSPNVLLCLFNGDVAEFDIYQKPETIHYGFAGKLPNFTKPLRKPDGTQGGSPVSVPLKNDSEQQKTVVKFDGDQGLYQAVQTAVSGFGFQEAYSVGQFALELVEGMPRVKFKSHS